MMKKHFFIGIPTLALAAITLGASVGMGQPSPTPTSDAVGQEESEESCLIIPNQPLQCFTTEAEALRAASGGRINLTPGQRLGSLTSAQLQQSLHYIEAILYDGRNYTGKRLFILSPNTQPSCPSKGNIPRSFDNRTSSLWVQDRCGITLYENANQRGRHKHFNPGRTPWVGRDLDNRASSYSLP